MSSNFKIYPETVGPGDITGLTVNQVLVGAADGSVFQTANFTYDIVSGAAVVGGAGNKQLLSTSGNIALNGTQTVVERPAPNDGGGSPIFRVQNTADINQPPAEVIDVDFNLALTKTFSSSSFTTIRAVRFTNPAYAFNAPARTITNAATVAIVAAPTAGANCTITNPYALWVQSGVSRFDGAIRGNASPGGTGPAMWSNANTGTNAGRIFVDDTSGAFMGYGSSTILISSSNISAVATGTANIQGNGGITNAFGGSWACTRTASSSGSSGAWIFTGSADTNYTASTEVIGLRVNQAQTKQWATGALTTQRANVFDAPTYAFVGASTITNAATVAITGAPAAGTNASITNRYALWVQSNNSRFDGNVLIGATGSSTASNSLVLATSLAGVPSSPGTDLYIAGVNGGGNTKLSVYSNQAVEAVAPTLTHRVEVYWNGALYYLGLEPV